jgi:hypothetical protein
MGRRMNSRCSQYLSILPLLCVSPRASAHFFGKSYSLPIPFSMYAWGASAALIISFVLVVLFAHTMTADRSAVLETSGVKTATLVLPQNGPLLARMLQTSSVVMLCLTIVTGSFATQDVFANLGMTWFWVVFALAFTYLTAIIGGLYEIANPWRALCEWTEGLAPGLFAQRVEYHDGLAYWPALTLYYAYIWIELFGHTRPRSLALILLGYTAVNMAGALWFGKEAWFRYGEFFGIVLRLISKMAPLAVSREVDGRIVLKVRLPFVELIREPAEHPSLILLALFMLSSTAFDGAHDTLPWVGLFWRHIYPVFGPAVATFSAHPYVIAPDFFYLWQWIMLALSPFVYYGVFATFIWLTQVVAQGDCSLRELTLRFGLTLVPIAFVYNITHYFTLLITQVPALVRMVSDPLGNGWNLFGTGTMPWPQIIPDAGIVWHIQVLLILVGHVVGVYLSHLEVAKAFPNSRRAVASELPMLALMVVFTTIGLWILALPIVSGQVFQPVVIPGK